FGKRTGIALPREVLGLFPTKEWKMKRNGLPWQQGETLSCSIGQSYVLSTTLQLASAYAAIANKGTIYKPFMVKEILGNNGAVIKEYTPEVINTIKLKPSTWDSVRNGLYRVANEP